MKVVVDVRIGRRQFVIDRDVDVGIVANDEDVQVLANGARIEVQKVKRQTNETGATVSFDRRIWDRLSVP